MVRYYDKCRENFKCLKISFVNEAADIVFYKMIILCYENIQEI